MILTRAEHDALPEGLRPRCDFRLPGVANLSELVTLLYEEGERVKAQRDALQVQVEAAEGLAEALKEALRAGYWSGRPEVTEQALAAYRKASE